MIINDHDNDHRGTCSGGVSPSLVGRSTFSHGGTPKQSGYPPPYMIMIMVIIMVLVIIMIMIIMIMIMIIMVELRHKVVASFLL